MKVLVACEESQAVRVDRRCMNCKWYCEDDRGEEWEENDG